MLPPMLFLADISGQDVITTVFWIICGGLIWWLLVWLVDYCGLPQPFNKVAKVLLAVIAVFFLINLIMGLAGHPMMKWR